MQLSFYYSKVVVLENRLLERKRSWEGVKGGRHTAPNGEIKSCILLYALGLLSVRVMRVCRKRIFCSTWQGDYSKALLE